MQGTLSDAIREREDLKEVLRRELENEAKQRTLGIDAATAKKETLSVYAKRWVDHLEKTGRNRKHVVDQHVHVLERFILPSLGWMEVEKITRRDLVTWMENLGDLQFKGEPYAKLTLNGAWATLRCMLKDAMVLCDLKMDPTDGVRFRVRGKEAVEKDVLTRDELGRFLEMTEHESDDMRAMIWVGFTTGMRFGELSALTWSDIDFERGLISVRKSQVKGNVGPTKTRSHRTVPLHPVVAEILKAHGTWQRKRRVRGLETDLLFPSEKGGHRFSNVLTKPLARCAKAAGLDKHVTAHTMRRTFNNLARQAAGEIVARSMTGHTTTAMTEHYSFVTPEEKSRAVTVALGLLGTQRAAAGAAGVNPSTSEQNGPNPSTPEVRN